MNKREKALAFIRANQVSTTIGPTLRELAEHLGVVPNGAQQHVAALRKEGLVEANDGRGLVIVSVLPKSVTVHADTDRGRAAAARDERIFGFGVVRKPLLKPSGGI